MEISSKDWAFIHKVLLSLYPIQDAEELQQFTLQRLEEYIPHQKSFFDLGFSKQGNIHFFHPLSFNMTKEELDTYYTNYQQTDYTIWNFSTVKPMVYRDSDLMGDTVRERSAIYQEWMKPMGIFYGLGCTIVNRQFYGSITLFRKKEDGDFTERETKILEILNEHLSSHLSTLYPNGLQKIDLLKDTPDIMEHYHLTNREVEIIRYICRGYNNQEIASSLCIAETTVKKHVSHIFEKTHVKNRNQLILAMNI